MLSLRVFAIIASVLWLLYYRILVRLYALCLCWNQAPHSSSQTNPVFLCISSGVSAAVSCTGASSRLLTCTVCRSGHEVLNLQGCWVACSTSTTCLLPAVPKVGQVPRASVTGVVYGSWRAHNSMYTDKLSASHCSMVSRLPDFFLAVLLNGLGPGLRVRSIRWVQWKALYAPSGERIYALGPTPRVRAVSFGVVLGWTWSVVASERNERPP